VSVPDLGQMRPCAS